MGGVSGDYYYYRELLRLLAISHKARHAAVGGVSGDYYYYRELLRLLVIRQDTQLWVEFLVIIIILENC